MNTARLLRLASFRQHGAAGPATSFRVWQLRLSEYIGICASLPPFKSQTQSRTAPSMADSNSASTSTTRATSKSGLGSLFSSRKSEAGQPKSTPKQPEWMDASLSDKERWKKWEKERDKQFYGKGGTAGYFTSFYGNSKAW